ncbi:MAG: acetolactate synthase small subunit [Calditrichaeota bacterium]|nr:MAG: acetolactate synthase small subunit [Calditrichota bacterium]
MKHTISVYFKNNFNALSRIIGLFSSRGFNIDSVSFGETKEPGMAHMTITTRGDEVIIEQITNQLAKIIDVVHVKDLTYAPFVERQLALIKVRSTPETRMEIIEVVNVFRAKIIDISPSTLTIEVTGKEDKVNAAISMLETFGLLEVARTGSVALKREFQGAT